MDLLTGPTSERSRMQISDTPGYQLNASNTGDAGGSSFITANDVRIKDSAFSMTVTNNITASTKSSLDDLYRRVAPHAILNKGGRGEDAKCHPGTRVEVIGIVEKWMGDVHGERIFWMSGPMGGGKTAIMKTIAERSAHRDEPTVNFFFFRGDETRNRAQPLVATLLYQLFQRYPSTLAVAAEIISKRPRILDESLDEQCELISALFSIIRQSARAALPIVLLIDGLDECDVDGESAQPDILRALERLVTQADSPFRLLVASRREARIQMAFNELPSRAHSIFLSEEYSPEKDIQVFVEAEFARIKVSHPMNHLLPSHWPSSSDVESIVTKSSGQFIYASTVMRYLSDPDTPPTLSLEQVMGLELAVNNSPFARLDNIYMFILNRASDQDAARAMLAVKFMRKYFSDLETLRHHNPRYNRAFILSSISKLSSIIRLDRSRNIQFYHASLTDFLVDRSRSGPYWINTDMTSARLVGIFWRKLVVDNTFPDGVLFNEFVLLRNPTPDITDMLINLPLKWMILESNELLVRPLNTIKKLYYDSDIKTYKQILRRVILMAISCNAVVPKDAHDLPHVKGYISSYRRQMWWSRLLHILGKKKNQ